MEWIVKRIASTFYLALLAGCSQEVTQSPTSLQVSAIQSDTATEMFVSGKGFTPGAEIQIKITHYPHRIGEINRGTTADGSGAFTYRESFNVVSVPKSQFENNIIISAWDTTGAAPPAVMSKPYSSFAVASTQ